MSVSAPSSFNRRPSLLSRAKSGDRSGLAILTIILLGVGLLIAAYASITIGAAHIKTFHVIGTWFGLVDVSDVSRRDIVVLQDIRLPRMFMGMLVGAALAVGGALMQGLFRNPLADPGLVGVSAGAGFGAVLAIVAAASMPPAVRAFSGYYTVAFSAFVFSWIATYLLYQIATRNGKTSVATMLLAGIAMAALTEASTGLFVFSADDQQLRDLTFWRLGSLAGATWTKLYVVAPIVLVALTSIFYLARGLNGLALGETAAQHMGLEVQNIKRLSILVVAIIVGTAVAATGSIGFVGIVVPHLLRLLIGPDNRYLLPASILLGAILLLIADIFSRIIVAPAELPIGIVTAIIGAPFFLWILLKRRGVVDM